MKLVRILLKYSPATLAAAIVAGALSGLASAGLLAVVNEALAAESAQRPELIGKFLILVLVAPLTGALSGHLLVRISQRAIFDLRMILTRQILKRPLGKLEQIGPHRLLAALTQDIASISGALSSIPALSISSMIVVGCLAYVAWLSGVLFGALLVVVAAAVLAYQLPMLAADNRMKRARREIDRIYGHFQALTEGIKELKLHRRRRDAYEALLESDGESYRRLNTGAVTIYRVTTAWGSIVVFLIIAFGLFAAPGSWDLTTEVLTGLVLVLLYMSGPLADILVDFPRLNQANVALRSIEALGFSFERAVAEEASPRPIPPPAELRRVHLRQVTHRYHAEGEPSPFVVGPVDLSLKSGELIFLVGGNGSGKTTLAKILTGLYAPDEGEILVDGEPVTHESRQSYREMFSAVFSDFFVFDTLLGLEKDGLDEMARSYLVRLQLERKVQIENGKLSTVKLSQGQRKRLALLTAYLEDRPFYLFDEWAADQDPYFKEVFYRELLPELRRKGKTVIVITHDDRYFHLADRIVKMESGRVVGVKTPQEQKTPPGADLKSLTGNAVQARRVA